MGGERQRPLPSWWRRAPQGKPMTAATSRVPGKEKPSHPQAGTHPEGRGEGALGSLVPGLLVEVSRRLANQPFSPAGCRVGGSGLWDFVGFC